MAEFCCAHCLSKDAVVQCGHGCKSALYCGQDCANAHYETHEMQCIEARAGRQRKVKKVLEEYKRGQLHSGSKSGPIVTNRKQALAIALAESRKKIGHQPGDPPTFTGSVVVSGNFVMIRLLDMSREAAFQVARSYVAEQGLGWKIQAPRAWTDYQTGPHITLTPDMKKYNGEMVDVQLGKLYHFEDGHSRWVAFHAKLPAKFTCSTKGCHVSVGQQKVK